MQKESFYFPHFCNARHDRKIQRMRSQLGIEGYGIYFMLLEVLREQHDLHYPIQDIDLLASEFNTSQEKITAVVTRYGLFDIDEEQMFFSPKMLIYLEPYFKMKQQRIEAGKKSGLIRSEKAKTPKEIKQNIPQVYIIECYNDDEIFIKIGITNGTISSRFSGHLPYNYRVLDQIFSYNNLDIENELHLIFSQYKYIPSIKFSGDFECYSISSKELILNYVKNLNERCSNENEQSKVNESKVNESKVNEIKVKKSLLERKNEFLLSINQNNIERLSNQLDSFIDYWTEVDSKENMRFEKEKFFDVNRRVSTWVSRSYNKKEFEKPQQPGRLSRFVELSQNLDKLADQLYPNNDGTN